MNSIKNSRWLVKIEQLKGTSLVGWVATTADDLGIHNNGEWKSESYFSTVLLATANFERFAIINEITNYKIVE